VNVREIMLQKYYPWLLRGSARDDYIKSVANKLLSILEIFAHYGNPTNVQNAVINIFVTFTTAKYTLHQS